MQNLRLLSTKVLHQETQILHCFFTSSSRKDVSLIPTNFTKRTRTNKTVSQKLTLRKKKSWQLQEDSDIQEHHHAGKQEIAIQQQKDIMKYHLEKDAEKNNKNRIKPWHSNRDTLDINGKTVYVPPRWAYRLMPDGEKKNSIMNQQILENVFQRKGQAAAKKHLKENILNGTANHVHCAWAMDQLCDDIGTARALLNQMETHTIPIEENILNTLIYKLLFQNKRNLAKIVVDVDFPKYGLQPNHLTKELMSKADRLASMAGKNITNEMKSLLKAKGKDSTVKYLNALIASGRAKTINCMWAIKQMRYTSEEIRVLINHMWDNDMSIGKNVLNGLMYQLILENKPKEAQGVTEIEFDRYGLKPNRTTLKLTAKANELLNLNNTSLLQSNPKPDAPFAQKLTSSREQLHYLKKMFESNRKQDALKHLMELISKGNAETIHCNWGLEKVCQTSQDMRDLMQHMKQNGVSIDALQLNTLIRQLLFENKRDEAQVVVDVDFEGEGLQPSDKTYETMARANDLASMGYTKEMKDMLKHQGKSATMNYLNALISNGKANAMNCNWGTDQMNYTSEEQRDLMKLMDVNNMPMQITVLNNLIQILLMENKVKEARDVVEVDFQLYGLKPNRRTFEMMKE